MTDVERILASRAWRECRPKYAAEVGVHSYLIRGRTIDEADWQVVAAAIEHDGVVERYTRVDEIHRYLHVVLDGVPFRLWAYDTVLNRAARSLDDHELVADQDVGAR
jgi:hypothetical protein